MPRVIWNIMNKTKNFQPILGIQVLIKTNWKSYFARLVKSEFGGVVFHVSGSGHRVEMTTVIGWKFPTEE